jgi:hypothetical protein
MTTSRPSFYVADGNLRREAPSYVERQSDVNLCICLRAAELCNMLDSRQMGKSSKMVLLDRCLEHGQEGRDRWVGWPIVTSNLLKIAQAQAADQAR